MTPVPLNPDSTYLPFGELLNRLQDQGFELGPDHYIRVQELLQRYVKRGAGPTAAEDPLLALRYHLAALLAQSESQQAIFHQVFDAYVAEMEGPWYEVSPPPPPPEARRARWWLWLTLIPIVGGLLWWFAPTPTPEAVVGFIATPINSRHSQTLEFRDIGQYQYPSWVLASPPSPDSLHWDFGDGESSTDSLPTHHYQQAGTYQVGLTTYFSGGDTLHQIQQVVVRPLERLRASLSYEPIPGQPNAYLLFNTSYLFDGDSLYRPTDTLFSSQLRWEVEGEKFSSKDSIQITASPDQDSLRIYLIIEAQWRDTTAKDSVLRIIRQLRPPVFPSLRKYLVNPDLSDLIQTKPRNWRPVVLLLALLLSYLAYEFYRARQRKVSLNSAPDRGPPSRHPLQLNEPGLELFHSREFYAIARELRRRRSGEQRKRPDLPRSIQKSAEAGGFPELVWQTHSQPSQYLLLIEQQHPQDHLARLYAEIGRELASRDISVEVYFYQGDPRYCWRKKSRESLPLARLRNLFPNYRLLVIGYGDSLLREDGRKLDPWTEVFESWQERGWLSIRPAESWGMTERALAASFVLVPATQLGLVRLVEQWQAEEPLLPQQWQQLSPESDLWLPDEDSIHPEQLPTLLTELRVYLGPDTFRWLAACSWYPDLRWGLSLQMASLLQHQGDQETALQLDIDGLLRLFRLPWLRTGKLPEWLRAGLAESLPEAEARAVRTHLLHLLSEPRNQPPEESYAEVDHVVRLAWLEYQNSAQSKADRKRLVEQLKDIDPEEIEDYLSLQELGKVPTTFSPLLPARDFRGSIPLFGLRQQVRMRWLGIPLLLGLLGSLWFSWSGQRQEAYDPTQSYEMSELNLQTAMDTARYYNHEGYLIGTDSLDSTQTGFDQFSLAGLQTAAKVGLYGIDSLTLHNFRLATYQSVWNTYQRDGLGIGQSSITLLEQGSRNWQIGRMDPRTTQLMQWYEALWGTALLIQNDSNALSHLSIALCQTVDSAAQANESSYVGGKVIPSLSTLSLQPDFNRLIEARLADQADNPAVAELLACLGQDSLIRRPVFLNLRIQDAESGQPIPAAKLLVTDENDYLSDANGRIFFRYPEAPETREPGQISLAIEAAGYVKEGHVLRLLVDSTQVQSVRLRKISGTIQANFADSSYTPCIGGTITFYDQSQSDGAIVSWSWDFGDGTRVQNITNPTHAYSQTGAYEVQLIVTNALGDADTVTKPIEIAGPPVASITIFEVDDNPFARRFDAYQGDRDMAFFFWDFGDGETGYGRRVVHKYAEPGTYQVKLVVDAEEDLAIIDDPLVVGPSVPRNTPCKDSIIQQVSIFSFVPPPTMISIPAGTFQMGDVMGGDEFSGEKPVHPVTLPAFQLSETEVSFAEYDAYCAAMGKTPPEDEGWGRGDRPVIYVDWYDAILYCNWLSVQAGYQPVYQVDSSQTDPNNSNSLDEKKWFIRADWTANGYRLPTEAEWEYAARQAGDSVRFGNGRDTADATEINFDASEEYKQPYSTAGQYRRQTISVRSLRPNSLGLYHMSGNVYEWCWDWYGSTYYQSSPNRYPKGPSGGSYRVLRGGSWDVDPQLCRVAYRDYGHPDYRSHRIGFRLARTP